MSDEEENNFEPENEVEVEVEQESGADVGSTGQMTIPEALKVALKNALIHDGLARGIREATKAIDSKHAHLCILNESCEEEAYKNLVIALCSHHQIPLVKLPNGKQLGEWAGLCQIDREGNPRKILNCSCVVITDYGEESPELDFLRSSLG